MGYALEILEPGEREDYGAHLLRCTFCRQLVGEHQSVTELLPDILLEEKASPGLKERILSGARGEAEGAVGPNQDARHGRWPRWTWSTKGLIGYPDSRRDAVPGKPSPW